MKRKMVYIGIPYAAGLFLASFFNSAYDFGVAIIVFAVAVIMKYAAKMKNKQIIVCIGAFILSFGIYRLYEVQIYNRIMSFNGQEINFDGEVGDINEYANDKSSYTITGKINGNVRASVSMYGNTNSCEIGDKICLSGVAKAPENTYIFGTEDYYKAKGIFLQMYDAKVINIKKGGFSIVKLAYDFRDRMISKIKAILPGSEGSYLCGLVFGDTSGISDAEKISLYRSGIGHVMSVSGLHIVILSAVAMWFLRRMKAGVIPSFIVSEFLCLALVFCAGMAMSAIRAFIMVTISQSSVFFRRRSDVFSSLCIAVIVMTFTSPFLIRDASFLLSVAGTFGIGVFAPFMTKNMEEDTRSKKAIKSFAVMVLVSAFTFPLSLLYFDETSIVSPITNVILVPICMIALICGIITVLTAAVPFIAYPMLCAAGLSCRIVMKFSDIISSIRYTHIPLDYDFIRIGVLLFCIFAVTAFLIFKSPKTVAVTISLSIVILLSESVFYQKTNDDVLKIAVLGKGTNATLVVTMGSQTDIIDLSGNYKLSQYVSKYLTSKGIEEINSVTLLQRPYAAMSAYESELSSVSVDSVLLSKGTYLLDGDKVFGNSPVFTYFENNAIEYENYGIYLISDEIVEIRYNDFVMRCAKDEEMMKGNVCLDYGSQSVINAECGYLILLDEKAQMLDNTNVYIGENNIVTEVSAGGGIKIRRL